MNELVTVQLKKPTFVFCHTYAVGEKVTVNEKTAAEWEKEGRAVRTALDLTLDPTKRVQPKRPYSTATVEAPRNAAVVTGRK